MKKAYTQKVNAVKANFGELIDWVLDHTKIVMPIVLILCVFVTVVIALNANKKEKMEQQAEMTTVSVMDEQQELAEAEAAGPIPDLPLEKNAYPEINAVIEEYYSAMADGNIEVVSGYNQYIGEIEKIRVEELGKYIENYTKIDVYTKAGMTEGSYVAYVSQEVKFLDLDQVFPGYQVYYVSKEEDGTYSIIDGNGTYDESIYNYIVEVSLQNDVVELNNKIAVAYNDLLASDEELQEYVAYLAEKLDENVGEILAQAEHTQEAPPAEEIQTLEADGEDAEVMPVAEAAVYKVKATDVVNIRSSDSETADRLDKAEVGQEFILLEEKGNGWSKVQYDGREAYIKSEFLEVIEQVSHEAIVPQETASETEQTSDASESSKVSVTNGTVRVKESIRVRSDASTDSDSLGTAFAGEKLDFVENLSSGWTKVKYNGKTGYVKTEYLE